MSLKNKNQAVRLASSELLGGLFRLPFERTAAERAALPAEGLLPITLDVPLAITTVLGALPALQTLRPQLAAEFTRFPIGLLNKLEPYARALGHAHSVYLMAGAVADALPATLTDAMARREALRLVAVPLVARKMLPLTTVGALNRGTGYLEVAVDLMVLVASFRGAWSELEPKIFVTATELDEAETVANQLWVGLAARETPNTPTESSLERRRAFTLLANAWNQVQRAVTYVRWEEGDVDNYAPTIYVQKPRVRAKEPPAPERTPAAPTGPAASAAPAAPAAPEKTS